MVEDTCFDCLDGPNNGIAIAHFKGTVDDGPRLFLHHVHLLSDVLVVKDIEVLSFHHAKHHLGASQAVGCILFCGNTLCLVVGLDETDIDVGKGGDDG